MLSLNRSFACSEDWISASEYILVEYSNRQDYGVYVNEIEKLVRLYKVTWAELIRLTLAACSNMIDNDQKQCDLVVGFVRVVNVFEDSDKT